MASVMITRGLRKLEFIAGNKDEDELSQARVDFVRSSPLTPGEPVNVPLGIREGKLRLLVGVPQLVKEPAVGSAVREYLYRLSGHISEEVV